jgi:Zn-finger protein
LIGKNNLKKLHLVVDMGNRVPHNVLMESRNSNQKNEMSRYYQKNGYNFKEAACNSGHCGPHALFREECLFWENKRRVVWECQNCHSEHKSHSALAKEHSDI